MVYHTAFPLRTTVDTPFLHLNRIISTTPELMAVFGAFGTIKWILLLVAIAEIVGGVLVAIPRYRALSAIVILPAMVGIVVHHATHDLSGIGLGLVLFLINVWVIVENRDKYLSLVK